MIDITAKDIISLTDDAVSIRNEILKAELTKCTCSGFQLQYDGCSCERAKKLSEIKKKTKDFFAELDG